MLPRSSYLALYFFLVLLIAGLPACVSADPTLVARAIDATLAAVPTATPLVFVVTALGGSGPVLPTVTLAPAERQTLLAATQTIAAGSVTPVSPSPSPLPSLTPSPEPPADVSALTPSPSPLPAPPSNTPPASITPPAQAALLLADDFSTPGNWPTGEDDTRGIAQTAGRLVIDIRETDRFAIVYNIKRRARSFYAEVTGAAETCRYRDRYGLLFRLQDSGNYYRFEVDCDRRYRLSKIVSGELTPLKDWTASDFIHGGGEAPNILGVRAVGEYLDVFVNGQFLGAVRDDTFAEGAFGLYAGSGISATYEAYFDDLRVWEVKK